MESSSICITQGLLVKYLAGELTGAEMNHVERHIAACSMCADELEGLSLLNEPTDIEGIVKGLDRRIEEITQRERRPLIPLYAIRVAATMLIVIAISTLVYFLVNQLPIHSDSIALSEHMINEEFVPIASESYELDSNEFEDANGQPEPIHPIGIDGTEPREDITTASPEVVSRHRTPTPPSPETIIIDDLVISDSEMDIEEDLEIFSFDIADSFHSQAERKSIDSEAAEPVVIVGYAAVRHEEAPSPRMAKSMDKESVLEEAPVFMIAEKMPEFKHSHHSNFNEYVKNALIRSEFELTEQDHGSVFVQFIVEPDGGVTNVEVIRGANPKLNKAVLEVISSSPVWQPGEQHGQKVRVTQSLSVVYNLE